MPHLDENEKQNHFQQKFHPKFRISFYPPTFHPYLFLTLPWQNFSKRGNGGVKRKTKNWMDRLSFFLFKVLRQKPKPLHSFTPVHSTPRFFFRFSFLEQI